MGGTLRVGSAALRPASFLHRFRRTGADLPFGDPRRAHGVGMEGYYWRFTDAAAGRVVVALAGVSAGPGGPWALVTLVVHPEGIVRWAVVPEAETDPRALGVRAGSVLAGDAERVRVRLPGADLEADIADPRPWPPRRAFGGLGPAQAVPGLPQYWHPHLLGGRATGALRLDGAAIRLDGAHAYAEKNWGAAFHPDWWWGQADAFLEADACVAFAGGRLRLAGIPLAPTAVVVRLGDELLRLVAPFAVVTAAATREHIRVRARSARHVVHIDGDLDPAAAYTLPVPVPGARDTQLRSHHVLAGQLRLTVQRGRRVVLAAESTLAGLERGEPV